MHIKLRPSVALALILGTSAAISLGMGSPPKPIAPPTAPASMPVPAVAKTPSGVERIELWPKAPGEVEGTDTDSDPTIPTMDLFLPPPGKATGAAVVIFPGGGYEHLATGTEGYAVARVFLTHNIAAFVVRYRHAPRYMHPMPLLDAQRAIRTVRTRAADFHVNPDRIGVIGFSAGGHLAACTATLSGAGLKPDSPYSPDSVDSASARPDFAILMYPVISLTDDAIVHKGSRTALTKNDPTLDAALSPDQHVSKQTPPIFLVQGSNDKTVPVLNSVRMYEACVQAGVPAEMHIFENGPHGFGLGASDPELKTWPDLAMQWMVRNKFLEKP